MTRCSIAIVGTGLEAVVLAHALAVGEGLDDVVVVRPGPLQTLGPTPVVPDLMRGRTGSAGSIHGFVQWVDSFGGSFAEHRDLLVLCRSESEVRAERWRSEVAGSLGHSVSAPDSQRLTTLVGSTPDSVGAYLWTDCAVVELGRLSAALDAELVSAGVQTVTGGGEAELLVEGGRVLGVKLGYEVVPAETVVLAGPNWRSLAPDPHGAGGAAHHLTIRTGPMDQRIDPIVGVHGLDWRAVQAVDGTVTVSQPVTAHSSGSPVGMSQFRQLAAQSVAALPALATVRMGSHSRRSIEWTPDGQPLVGPATHDGLMLFAGWGTDPTAVPVRAKELALLLAHGKLANGLSSLSPQRFREVGG